MRRNQRVLSRCRWTPSQRRLAVPETMDVCPRSAYSESFERAAERHWSRGEAEPVARSRLTAAPGPITVRPPRRGFCFSNAHFPSGPYPELVSSLSQSTQPLFVPLRATYFSRPRPCAALSPPLPPLLSFRVAGQRDILSFLASLCHGSHAQKKRPRGRSGSVALCLGLRPVDGHEARSTQQDGCTPRPV